jgi:hypothetical protein
MLYLDARDTAISYRRFIVLRSQPKRAHSPVDAVVDTPARIEKKESRIDDEIRTP